MKINFVKIFLILIALSLPFLALSQEEVLVGKKHNKGRLTVYWGWNRAMFTHSDIHFNGSDHDFTLSKVVAFDRPTKFAADPYFNPALITIPQTNFRIGYFISDKWEISFGVDHMKYVMVQDQIVKINGYINSPENEYNGVYENEDIVLTEDFLTFEHTDGLNYGNIEINRFENLVQFNNFSKVDIDINVLGGLGAGLLVPKSNVQLFGENRNDSFHLAGWGLSAKLGLNLTFWNYFFLQTELKGGFIDLPNIITSTRNDYQANQNFFYTQWNFVFGGSFPLIKQHKEK